MHRFVTRAMPLLLALALAGTAQAMSTGADGANLDEAKAAIDAGEHVEAIRLLEAIVDADTENADAWNYLGYSLRQENRLGDSLAAYRKALELDPEHRGAHEYLGELYLKMGEVDKAKSTLKQLDELCLFGCDERDALAAAIEKHGG